MSDRYAMIDVETTPLRDGERPRTLFWGYADEHGYKRFETTRSLQRFLLREERGRTLLHHSDFDVTQLLVDGARNLRIHKSHNGRLILSSYRTHKLLNSASVFPVALQEIFACYGHVKTSLDNLEKRNYDDCVLGLDCCQKLDAELESLVGVSPLRSHTIAATAFRAAEKVAGRLPKDLSHIEAYRGGKNEVYDTRPHIASKFDINSSYPRSFVEAPIEDELLLCEVEVRDHYCPFFDLSSTDYLIFPNGKFKTYVYKSNLDYYQHRGHLRICDRYKVPLDWLRRVSAMALDIYNVKQASRLHPAKYFVAKLFLNSLYGRIGLKGQSERVRILSRLPLGQCTGYQILPGHWLVFDQVYREPRSNYPLAAYITDNARARLYQAERAVSALYVATDSVVTLPGAIPGYLGNGLGEWKHEGTGPFCGRNLNDYEFLDQANNFNVKVGAFMLSERGLYGSVPHFVKGGHGSLVWTLKAAAAGKSVEQVNKSIDARINKRILQLNGITKPLKV